ncbi:MAG TPA: hypothetical protein VGI44_07200 [Acidimicrobiales bacterium]
MAGDVDGAPGPRGPRFLNLGGQPHYPLPAQQSMPTQEPGRARRLT